MVKQVTTRGGGGTVAAVDKEGDSIARKENYWWSRQKRQRRKASFWRPRKSFSACSQEKSVKAEGRNSVMNNHGPSVRDTGEGLEKTDGGL